jgi:selenide, water dikinase
LLDSVLRGLPRSNDPNVLVGFETNDDAGVYKLGPEMALVQTVDFFTPIVDDPHTFGQIAAANSLSDIYAMGGKPISALSIVGFPDKGEPEILEQILRGGLSKMAEAKCSVIGGHSIRNDDIQFGYAVTGLIHPQRVWRNVGVRTGDVMVLTKALGTGVLSTALKKDCAAPADFEAAIASMSELNRAASEALQEFQEEGGPSRPVHAVTDITGFGLLGHAREMALGDRARQIDPVSLQIDHTAIRYLPGAEQAAREGFLPGGLKNNRDFLGDCVGFAEAVPQEFRDLLFDPQTSGGLLIAVAPESGNDVLSALDRHGVSGRRIGVAIPKGKPLLSVQ